MKETAVDIIKNILMLIAGTVICAVGINGILIPHHFVSSGITGLSLVIHYLKPEYHLSMINLALNVPIFIAAIILVRKRFFLYSIFGVICFTLALHYVYIEIDVNDRILSAILAGIITGLGGGIIFKSKGSAGGVDILSIILMNRFSIRLGKTILGFNAFVLILTGFIFTPDDALYTLISLYVSAKIVDLVVTGLSRRRVVYIISDKWKEINYLIRQELHKGITVISAKRASSGKDANMLYTVATVKEAVRIKEIVKKHDKTGMVIIQDTVEVMGRRMGNVPEW